MLGMLGHELHAAGMASKCTGYIKTEPVDECLDIVAVVKGAVARSNQCGNEFGADVGRGN